MKGRVSKGRGARLACAGIFVFAACVGPIVVATACGETRRPLGEQCLREDDCLSGFCVSRTCVAAPPTGTPPAQESPDTGATSTPGDSGSASDATTKPSEAGGD